MPVPEPQERKSPEGELTRKEPRKSGVWGLREAVKEWCRAVSSHPVKMPPVASAARERWESREHRGAWERRLTELPLAKHRKASAAWGV